AASAQADEAAAPAELPPRQLDGDGFSRPLDQLKFNPGLDQREFERATLDA
ncbi:VacJ family lipoprotein, partial [Escherichia coli]|nr:VacJ family lipoprotein [Escherichia coli]